MELNTKQASVDLSSPSGKMSKRARQAAERRLFTELFGDCECLKPKGPKQPTEVERLRSHATQLLELAERGMHPRSYRKKANEMFALADELEEKLKE